MTEMENQADLWKGTIEDLLCLPEAEYLFMLEKIKRERLQRQGFVFQDPHNPATCESCEG